MFGAYAMGASNAVLSMDGSELVRILDQRLSAYVPCAVRAMLQLSADYRSISWALSYTPAGPPQVFAPYLSRPVFDPSPPLAPCREVTLYGWLPTGLGPPVSELEGSSDDSSMRDGQPSVNGGTSRNSSASSSVGDALGRQFGGDAICGRGSHEGAA